MTRRHLMQAGITALPLLALPAPGATDDSDADEPLVPPPANATVLFDGKDLAAWVGQKGEPPAWLLRDGYVEVVASAGSILTREMFRDFQLHVEFRIPEPPDKARGNSGIYLQNKYEVQIMDSYGRPPELSGCGALYREVPPLRNAAKKPGRWQSFDIALRSPRFDESGELREKGLLTVFHNRALIHNNLPIPGMTGQAKRNPANDPRQPGPILLQNHGSPVRFRNLWIVPASAAVSVTGASRETGFLSRSVTRDGKTYRYQVYLPRDWTPDRAWPVILFLHGAGERGDDGLIQTEVGLGSAIRRHVDRFPAVVVMPQCRRAIWWPDPEMEAQALAALDQSMQEFRGEPSRVYLTGLSMGGYGTWSLAARRPGKFAAIAPVCGGIRRPAGVPADAAAENPGVDPYAEAARKIGSTPVWVFHGSADVLVPVTESRKMVEALKAAGGNVRYSEYEGVGHNSWDRAYRDPEFPVWLLGERRAP